MIRAIALLAVLLCGMPSARLLAQSATIESLGYLAPNDRYSIGQGVSPDGLTLRAQAAQQARMAGDRFYESFLAGGDGNALAAGMYAYYGSGLGIADLSSQDVHATLVSGSGERDPFLAP